MVGMNHRYRPDVQIVRSFVQSGELGTVESIRGSWHVFRPSRTQLGWRQRREQAGGGAMLDLGLSILDLGLWLGGSPKPTRVSASLDSPGKDRSVEQSGSAFVVCENGMSIFVDVTWHHLGEGERFGVGVRGSKGIGAINPLVVWKELHGVPVDVSPTGSVSRENPFTASYRAEWAHFEAAIAGEAQGAVARGPRRPAQDHRRDLQVGGGWQRRDAVKWGGALLALLLGRSSRHRRPQARIPPARGRFAGLPAHRLPHDDGARRAVWERFGHNAIWIHDSVAGTDIAYNYGLFDLRQENFLVRFIRGTDVVLDGGIPGRAVRADLRPGQPLGLDPGAGPAAARAARAPAVPRVERAAGESFLPLRLLSRQLFDPGA